MSPDPEKLFVDWAERELRHYFGDDLTREAAAPLLSMWAGLAQTRRDYPEVAAELESLILSRFRADPMEVGKDFLPQGIDWALFGSCDCKAVPGAPCRQKGQEREHPHYYRQLVEVTAQPTAEAVQP